MKRTAIALLLAAFPAGAIVAQDTLQLRDVTYENVTFSYHQSLAREYLAETVAAVPLVNKSEKPDGVWPRHFLITLRESYVPARRRETGGEFGEVRLYVFPTSDTANKNFDADFPTTKQAVDDLAAFLARRNPPRGKPVPFLPWADAGQAFVGKRKFLRFRNGRGVLFLTQYGQEKVPLNNSDLVYTFQGLTDDNAWYVSAVFPVIAPGLPPAARMDDPVLAARGIDLTVSQAAARLEKVQPRNFTPSLTMLENVIRSLKIAPR
jgi:hypothetical protein